MPNLSVKDFSCIESANLDLRRLNVIIGPQGSGKSVLTKLTYFFSDLLPGILRAAEDGLTYSEFKQSLERSFSVWFPSQAWGGKRFLINYTDGELQCRVMRRKISRKLSDEVKINLSPWIDEIYQNAFLAFSELKTDDNRLMSTDDISAHNQLERAWRVRAKVRANIEEKASGYSCFQQTFIPAGRAFFTSIGRLVAGIEHAGSLDPATLKFARLFARWRDRSGIFVSDRNVTEINEFRNKTMLKLFGGKIQSKREAEYIEMEDGRKVPFSSLSSGQQELESGPINLFDRRLAT